MPPRRSVNPPLLSSPEFVKLALVGIDREIAEARKRLATLEAFAAELRRQGKRGRPASKEAVPAPARTKARRTRRMSPEGRKRLSEMMKKRWAEYHASQAAQDKAQKAQNKRTAEKGQAKSGQ